MDLQVLMKKVEFSKKHEMDTDKLTNDHKLFIHIFNDFVDCWQNKKTKECIVKAIKEFEHYIKIHFSHEILRMRESAYHKSGTHEDEHSRIVQMFIDLKSKHRITGDDIYNLFLHYLKEHIEIFDYEYSKWCLDNEKQLSKKIKNTKQTESNDIYMNQQKELKTLKAKIESLEELSKIIQENYVSQKKQMRKEFQEQIDSMTNEIKELRESLNEKIDSDKKDNEDIRNGLMNNNTNIFKIDQRLKSIESLTDELSNDNVELKLSLEKHTKKVENKLSDHFQIVETSVQSMLGEMVNIKNTISNKQSTPFISRTAVILGIIIVACLVCLVLILNYFNIIDLRITNEWHSFTS